MIVCFPGAVDLPFGPTFHEELYPFPVDSPFIYDELSGELDLTL